MRADELGFSVTSRESYFIPVSILADGKMSTNSYGTLGGVARKNTYDAGTYGSDPDYYYQKYVRCFSIWYNSTSFESTNYSDQQSSGRMPISTVVTAGAEDNNPHVVLLVGASFIALLQL
jgi:hypothetical protein